jgi:cephalosporin hydroxylase
LVGRVHRAAEQTRRGIGILKRFIVQKLQDLVSKTQESIVRDFHRLYYHSKEETWRNTSWLGIPALKCPLDLWIFQEIIHDLKPDIIIECGTAWGGSALFLASICDLINNGKVITIDIDATRVEGRPKHERIKYLLGSSTSEEIVEEIRNLIRDDHRVMVILDSDHSMEHVLNELRIYSKLVTKGSYLIVEDTHVNGHPLFPDYGPGPMEAVDEFLKENEDFVVDREKEKFLLTFNPKGYLKKI